MTTTSSNTPQIQEVPARLPAWVYFAIEKAVLGMANNKVAADTTPVQAGVIIGRQEVLNLLRKEFTIL